MQLPYATNRVSLSCHLHITFRKPELGKFLSFSSFFFCTASYVACYNIKKVAFRYLCAQYVLYVLVRHTHTGTKLSAFVSALKSRLLLPLQINLSNCIRNSLFFFASLMKTGRWQLGGRVAVASGN